MPLSKYIALWIGSTVRQVRRAIWGSTMSGRPVTLSGGQLAQERTCSVGVFPGRERCRGEVGDAGVGEGGELSGDGLLVADDGDVSGTGSAFEVEHRPIRRELAVDREQLVGALAGGLGVGGDSDGKRAHTTRGAGRPAASAAAVILGTTWDSTVSRPVIHNTVPSATDPASSSIRGARAASRTGVYTSRGVEIVARAVTVSPSNDTRPSRSSGSSAPRYSRMWRAGFSNE